ncbi:MAG: hypothetical protein AAGI90_00775 [Chlamydiota bacterium]
MQKVLRNIFGIYPGEVLSTFRFVKFSVFWAFSTSCFETLADGLFLCHVGADGLPFVYFVIALALILFSSIILYLLRLTSPYRILCKTLTLFLIASGFLLLLFSYHELTSLPNTFWYLLKIYSRIFFAVFLALGWTFIDEYHDLQDAKRVYSLYSAAYFMGLILSGTCIHLFLDVLGQRTFFTFSAISVFFALKEARRINANVPVVEDDGIEGAFSGDRHSLSSMVQKLLGSPYTIALLALSLLQAFTLTTTEFNYMETFETAFQQGTLQKTFTASNLSEFLGKWRAWISFSNVLIGGFLYRPFVKKFGLTNVVLIPSLFFFFLYLTWTFHDSLPIAILGLIAVDGISFTIEDNNFNLLTKAVPSKLKSKVRIVNDSFFEPIGMMISSVLLLSLPLYQSRAFGLVLSVFLIIASFLVRALYSKALFTNLKEHTLRFKKTLLDWTSSWTKREKRLAKEAIVQKLQSPKESDKLLAIRTILALKKEDLVGVISEEMSGFTDLGKTTLLTLLDNSFCASDQNILRKIASWADCLSRVEFQQHAYFYLAKRKLLSPEKVLHHLDAHHPLWIRASAILTLKKTPDCDSLDKLALHRTIADRELHLLLSDPDPTEVLMGLRLLRETPSVESAQKALTLFSHAKLEIRREAAHVMAKVSDPSMYFLAPKILALLQEETDSKTRLYCLESLGKFSDSSIVKEILLKTVHFRPVEKRLTEKIIANMGLKNVPLILSVLKDVQAHDKPRILASKILARLSPAQLHAHLDAILHVEKERAYFYFYYGHTVQTSYPDIPLKDLTQTLLTSFQSAIDFIIHLLAAVGQVEDPELLVLSLHSKNAKVHSSAIEALETTCSPSVFSWILPLIEDLPFEEKLNAYKKYATKDRKLTLPHILQKLQTSPSTFDRIVAAKLKALVKTPGWEKELLQELKTCDENFHHFAYELLENETAHSY